MALHWGARCDSKYRGIMPLEAIWSAGQPTSHGFDSAVIKEVRLVVFVRDEEEVAPASSVLFACSEKATHAVLLCSFTF